MNKELLLWKLKNRKQFARETVQKAERNGNREVVIAKTEAYLQLAILIDEIENGDYGA